MGSVPDVVMKLDRSVDGTLPLLSHRLCNFPTGSAVPLGSHTSWMANHLSSLLTKYPDGWIDLFGYASKKGTASGYDNQGLSERRREAVKRYILGNIGGSANFLEQLSFGSSKSTGPANNDDGYWRAVDIYMYDVIPRGRKQEHVFHKRHSPSLEQQYWYVTDLSLSGGSYVEGFGGGVYWGTITFERPASTGVDADSYTGNIWMAGLGAGISLPKSASDAFGRVAARIARGSSPFEEILKRLQNFSGGRADLPSKTVGIAKPSAFNLAPLKREDFAGWYDVVNLNLSVPVLGGNVYGMDFNVKSGKSRGIALIASAGIAGSLSLLSGGAMIFIGEIGRDKHPSL